MDVASPLSLLQALAPQLAEGWAPLALARRKAELEQLVATQRASDGWEPCQALRLAHLWLVAGVPGRGDDLVLEAAELAPAAGLIPDWWGLWPSDAQPSADPQAEELVASYLQLRHLPPPVAWQVWRQSAEAGREPLDGPPMQLLLGLVIQGREWIAEPLEPVLVQVAGEELVTAEPALAWRFYDPLSERLPEWDYALLKAADLSLQRGELERCGGHLARGLERHASNPWLHDIAARLALAQGAVEPALAAWQRAIGCCDGGAEGSSANGNSANGNGGEMVELFRQRAREARRGPGVLQARSLLNRGDTAAAIALLEQLLAQDPQWQPLRSLLDQARPAAAAASGAAAGTASVAPASGSDLERLESRLEMLAQRAGLAWPAAMASADASSADAERWAAQVQQALGRLALLG
jgi:tetratricopeptide (TPR) repeat protein